MKEKVKQLFTNKIGRRVIVGLGIFLITLLLELFVFNYRAFINRGSSVDVSASNVICQNVKVVSSSSDGIVYEINSVDSPTFTIKFDDEKEIQTISAFIDFEHKDIYRYELNVEGSYNAGGSRYSSWSYRSLEYIKGLETSRYFEPGFNHPVDTIVLKFGTIDRVDSVIGQKFTLSKISFNYNVPFNFSAVRVFGLTIIGEGVFLLALLFVDRFKKNPVVEDKKVDIRKRVLNIIVYSLPIIGVILLFGFYGHFARAIALPNEGSQISKELVDAFLKGQVHLDIDVSKELAALSNPYDPASRNGISFAWDHLFFEGKYYSYYGVAPVLMVFLPFKFITGLYFQDAYAVLLFTIIGLVFMTLSYEGFLKQMQKKREIPLFLKYTLFLLLALGCGASFQVVRPNFYEVSTSSAFMCMMISLFHIFKSGIIFERKDNKLFYLHLAFSSVWLGLAVLSRATFALYALAHVGILIYYFVKNRNGMDKKSIALYCVSSLAPYLVFGSIQCVYNYVRFHSIFDFGIQYSLTIADFLHMPFHLGNVFTSIFHFFFNPGIMKEYPYFLDGNTLTFGSAFYFYETWTTIGLIYRMPFILLIFIVPFVIATNAKERIGRLIIGWFPCVIIPFIQVCLTWQSGYAIRYYSDFSWPLLFFAIYFVIRLYNEHLKTEKQQLLAFVLFTSHLVFSLLVTSGMVLMYVPSLTHYYGEPHFEYTNYYYIIGRQLSFWR